MPGRELVRWWVWSVGIWLLFGVLEGTQVVVGMRAEGMEHQWVRFFSVYALSWTLWGAVSPLILLAAKRYPPKGYWPVHIAAYSAVALAHGVWIASLNYALQPMGELAYKMVTVHSALSFTYSKLLLDLFAYASVLGVGYTMKAWRRLAERDEQLAQARLDALKRQLEPHFLFNALNGIVGLVRDGQNDPAVKMIAGLSDLLRRVVDGKASLETSLAEEMEFLHKYLDIQQMRFASRLRVEIDVPRELSKARVPSMILQPMVENAIEHGIGARVDGGFIRIAATRADDALTMKVENQGPALTMLVEGVGIANTRARLKNLYGDCANFSIRNNGGGVVEAIVTVPCESVE